MLRRTREIHIKPIAIIAIALPIVALGLALHTVHAQQGFNRFDLQRHDLSVPGREVIQVRVEIDQGVTLPRHTHPGEEIIYVLEGALEYEVEGQPTVTLKPGDVLFIPAGTSDWDITGAEQRAAWAKGEKAGFYPYGKTQAQVLSEQD